jgi:hypothetical protein
MNPIRRLASCLLNKRNDRALLNQWKAEGRIPENYWGPIQQIAADVEDEFRRENGIGPFIRNESGCILERRQDGRKLGTNCTGAQMTDNQKRAIVRKLAGIPGVQTAAEFAGTILISARCRYW